VSLLAARLPRLTLSAAEVPTIAVPDDQAIVRDAIRGGRAAFEELYRRYGRLVHGILLSRVAPQDAEDLVQDVFITVFEKISTVRDAQAFPAWLAAIARNRAAEFYRSSRIRTEVVEQAVRDTRQAPGTSGAEILAVIRSLPEAYRETLILRLVEGMTGPEIARRTGLTPDSVRVNLFRGMKLLRERLEGKGR
jgi:RNA polymerase sigma-70 factor (ECF subfamily)